MKALCHHVTRYGIATPATEIEHGCALPEVVPESARCRACRSNRRCGDPHPMTARGARNGRSYCLRYLPSARLDDAIRSKTLAQPNLRHPLSASELICDTTKIFCHDIPVAVGFEIALLQRAVFGGPRHEGGLQSVFSAPRANRRCERPPSSPARASAQQSRGAEIGLGIGLVVLEQFRRHHEIPGQARRTLPFRSAARHCRSTGGLMMNFVFSRVSPATLSGQPCSRCQPIVR